MNYSLNTAFKLEAESGTGRADDTYAGASPW